VDAQQNYALPSDMFAPVISVRYGSVLLVPTTKAQLDGKVTGWRDATKSTPIYWFPEDARKIGVYPKPTGTSTSFYVQAPCAPTTTGAKTITAISNATPAVVTCAGHGLVAQRVITIAGCDVAAFNANWVVGSASLATDTFSLLGSVASGAATTGTIYPWATPIELGGDVVAELINDSDVPAFPPPHHDLLVHGAVYSLAGQLLVAKDQAGARTALAKSEFDSGLAMLIEDLRFGVGS
jgi:hypothetical protein